MVDLSSPRSWSLAVRPASFRSLCLLALALAQRCFDIDAQAALRAAGSVPDTFLAEALRGYAALSRAPPAVQVLYSNAHFAGARTRY